MEKYFDVKRTQKSKDNAGNETRQVLRAVVYKSNEYSIILMRMLEPSPSDSNISQPASAVVIHSVDESPPAAPNYH